MRLFAALLAVVLFLGAARLYPANPDQNGVVSAMQDRRHAESQGDATRWETLVAADCVWIEPNGRVTAVANHRPRPSGSAKLESEVNISDTQVRTYGDFSVLNYREEVRTKVGAKEVKSVVRFTEVYRRLEDRWVLVHSSETPIVERAGVKVNTGKFKDYTGEYEIAPGLIGIVAWDGKTLTLFSKGWKQPYELVPLTENRFFVRQFETTEITFVRDANGKVIQQTSESPNQPALTAKKIK